MVGGSLLLFLLLFYFFLSSPIRSGEAFSSVIFPLFLFFYLFFGCSDGMEREACVCDHGLERSDLCAEIIIIIIIIIRHHGNARYFLDGYRPLWYMLPWYSAPTVMLGVFWVVIGHSGTCYRGTQPLR